MKIAFYIPYKFHFGILEPVSKILKDNGHECLLSMNHIEIDKYNSDVLVLSDDRYSLFPNRPVTFQTWHSLIGKNFFPEAAHSQADYICVNSKFSIKQFEDKRIYPKKEFLITGYPQVDPLFFPEKFDVTSFLEKKGLDRDKFTVIWAPTYNPELNSIELLRSNLDDLVHDVIPNANLIIKVHPVVKEFYESTFDFLLKKFKNCENIYFEEDTHTNIVPYLLASDMLISDVSGIIFQYMILERPILLYNPDLEKIKDSKFYNPLGIEFKFRDMAFYFNDERSFKVTLSKVFSGTVSLEEKVFKMQRYKNILYGVCQDGKNCERLATALVTKK